MAMSHVAQMFPYITMFYKVYNNSALKPQVVHHAVSLYHLDRILQGMSKLLYFGVLTYIFTMWIRKCKI